MTAQEYRVDRLPRCNQDTRRGEQCMHRARWTRKELGSRELYCTRHMRLYTSSPQARGFVPIVEIDNRIVIDEYTIEIHGEVSG